MITGKKLEELEYIYLFTYSVLQSFLFNISLVYYHIKFFANYNIVFNYYWYMLIGIILMTLIFGIIIFIINNTLSREENTRLLFIQIFITTIFIFSLAQDPHNFFLVGIYWCVMSPIGNMLSAGVFLMPYMKNRKTITIIGIISTAIGFASKFYNIPFINIIEIPLTMSGALLTVIGIGSPPTNER